MTHTSFQIDDVVRCLSSQRKGEMITGMTGTICFVHPDGSCEVQVHNDCITLRPEDLELVKRK